MQKYVDLHKMIGKKVKNILSQNCKNGDLMVIYTLVPSAP